MSEVGRRRIGMMGLWVTAALATGCGDKKPRRTRISEDEPARGRKLVTLTYVPSEREPAIGDPLEGLKAKLARAKLNDATMVRAGDGTIEVDVFGEDVSMIGDVKEVIATRRLTVAKIETSPDPLAALLGASALPPLVTVDTRVTKIPTAVVLFPKPPGGEQQARYEEIRTFVNKSVGRPVRIAFGCDDGPCTKMRSYVLAESPAELHVVVAEAVLDSQGPAHRPEVMVELSSESAIVFGEITKRCLGEPVAMLLDEEVLMAPVVQGAITAGSVRITMGDTATTMDDAKRLARRIRASGGPALELQSERR